MNLRTGQRLRMVGELNLYGLGASLSCQNWTEIKLSCIIIPLGSPLSFSLSVHNQYFFVTFFSSHPLETVYGTSSRGLLNSGQPVIYSCFSAFSFLDAAYRTQFSSHFSHQSMDFWKLHLWIVGLYLVSRNSYISCGKHSAI